MSWWTILSLFSPTLIASFGWVWSAKKASARKAELAAMRLQLMAALAELESAKKTIASMVEAYSVMESRRIKAEARADSIQMAAAELARQVAENPDAEAAARELAQHIKDTLNGTA